MRCMLLLCVVYGLFLVAVVDVCLFVVVVCCCCCRLLLLAVVVLSVVGCIEDCFIVSAFRAVFSVCFTCLYCVACVIC